MYFHVIAYRDQFGSMVVFTPMLFAEYAEAKAYLEVLQHDGHGDYLFVYSELSTRPTNSFGVRFASSLVRVLITIADELPEPCPAEVIFGTPCGDPHP